MVKALRDVPSVKSFNHHLALVAPPMLSGGVEGGRVAGVTDVDRAGVRVERGHAHEVVPGSLVRARLVRNRLIPSSRFDLEVAYYRVVLQGSTLK